MATETFEIVEQDGDIDLPIKTKKNNTSNPERTIKETSNNNTDKPAVLLSTLSSDIKEQITKDSKEILHGFHLNGRNADQLRKRTKDILKDNTKTKVLLVKAPTIAESGELQLINTLYVKWSETLFGFLDTAKPSGDFLAFIQDVKTKNIYMPCCHDVKPISPKQLLNHFSGCLASKVDGSKCAFCNSTDLTSNTYTTVNTKKEHIVQNTHLNSIYQVLEYSAKGLVMSDARTVDQYITVRPFSNYFLKSEATCFGYNSFLMFLRTHLPVQQIERTPIYNTLKMYQRLAKNKGKKVHVLPCMDCDTTLPTFTGFYLGKILELERVECSCGSANAFNLPLDKIDEIYDMVRQLVTKDNTTAGKSILLGLFAAGGETNISTQPLNLVNFDIDALVKKATTIEKKTVIVGEKTSAVDLISTARSASTKSAAIGTSSKNETTAPSAVTTMALSIAPFTWRAPPAPPFSSHPTTSTITITNTEEEQDSEMREEHLRDTYKQLHKLVTLSGLSTISSTTEDKPRKVRTGKVPCKSRDIETRFFRGDTPVIPTFNDLLSVMDKQGSYDTQEYLARIYEKSVDATKLIDEEFIKRMYANFIDIVAKSDISTSDE